MTDNSDTVSAKVLIDKELYEHLQRIVEYHKECNHCTIASKTRSGKIYKKLDEEVKISRTPLPSLSLSKLKID